jgi:hypothetical protein
MHALTESEIRNVVLDLRRDSSRFRVVYGTGEKEVIIGWPGWEVQDWEVGRAHRDEDPPGIEFPLEVSWDAVADAVARLRTRQERARQALPPPAPIPPPVSPGNVDLADGMPTAEAPPYQTGTQGRPTSISLIAAELERRRVAEQTLDTQTAEARALAEWLIKAHPEAPKCTDKTIRTSLVTQRPLRLAVEEAKARKERPK